MDRGAWQHGVAASLPRVGPGRYCSPVIGCRCNSRLLHACLRDDESGGQQVLVPQPGNTPDVASSAAALGVDVNCIVKSLVFSCGGEFVVVVGTRKYCPPRHRLAL